MTATSISDTTLCVWIGGVARFTPRQLTTPSLVSPRIFQNMVFKATSPLFQDTWVAALRSEKTGSASDAALTLCRKPELHGPVRISAPQILKDCSLCTLQVFCLNTSVVVNINSYLAVTYSDFFGVG